jgi:8-oxo-dGTP pyrophosphatase MutT (NUDIX family)
MAAAQAFGPAVRSFHFPNPHMAEALRYSAEDFRRRVNERLVHNGEAVGDHLLNPEIADLLLNIERRAAAVLVPVIHRVPEATILFTERTGGLRAHAGQISFPGGRIDPEDSSPEAAALREASEEIGLKPEFIETVGRAPDYLTGSGYHVAVVVALVRPGFELSLNSDEVADVFEVPLSFLMDPDNHQKGTRLWHGAQRSFFEMPFESRHIWGITAGIVRILYERLYADTAARSQE